MAKRVGPALFAISIVDNLCVLHLNKSSTIKLRLPLLIINVPCVSNFMTFLDFFISHRKKLSLSRGYIGRWGHAIVAVAVVEPGLNKSQCMDCPPRQKKSRCGEVAVSGGSTVEMLFFNFILGLNNPLRFFWVFFFFSQDDQTSAPEVFSSCSFNPGAYFETRWSITMVTRYDVTSSRWSTRENEVPHSPLVVKSFLSDNASFFNFFLL